MRLGEFILGHKPRILATWEALVSSRLPAAKDMDSVELRDHVPQLLEAIVVDLSTYQIAEPEAAISMGLAHEVFSATRTAAQTHGLHRAKSGFDIQQLASEYRDLRATVLSLWIDACLPDQPLIDDVIHFDGAIAEALAESITFFNDYKERLEREAQDIAETGQRTLEALMEYLPVGIILADAPDGTITHVSRYGQGLIGRPLAEIAGVSAEQYPIHWDLYDQTGTVATTADIPLTRALKGEIVRNEEWRFRRPDGTTMTILCNAGPIRAADGSIAGGLIAWHDIDDLKVAQRALEEMDRRKDEFIATLAHELRNPLAPVHTAVRVLGTPTASASDQQRSREVIDRQVATMARLLDDLLDISRIKQRKLELRKESVLLWTVLGNAIEMSKPLIEARRHRLNVKLPDGPVPLDADPVRLCQVVANLLNNAAKYTAPGGRIELVAVVEADEVRIEITDTGVGMSSDSLDEIFVIFSQVETSLPAAEGGLGIGLSLAKGLMELHGGQISARSDGPGKGSVFTLVLPRGRSTSPEAHGRSHSVCVAWNQAPRLDRR